ncbi:MAG: MTH1187 family thiamine-binding protein [Candidatus Krumholzibacteriota bacterium]|nr:MTH1187 family thiamine-binding protein [Candidatus Krumholzibacteriota bacterium]
MAVCSVSVVPLGTGSPSLSAFVARCQEILGETEGVRFRLTPMSTVIEGETETILAVVARLHRAPFDAGALRVMTLVNIDERRDTELTMDGKVASVEARLR